MLLIASTLGVAEPAAQSRGIEASLSLTVETNGGFTIVHDGRTWLAGGDYRVNGLSSSAGTLALLSPPTTSGGSDPLGRFKATTLVWGDPNAGDRALMHTTFRTYPSDPAVIVFEQFFPHEINLKEPAALPSLGCVGIGKQCAGASTLFPSFWRGQANDDHDESNGSRRLHTLSYHGVFPQLKAEPFAEYAPSHQGGVPLVLYNASDAALPMVVFSPLTLPKAQHMDALPKGPVGIGVKDTAHLIPANHSTLAILSAGSGINSGMMAWGDRMLKFHAVKARVDKYRDQTHATLGFWTDNGGYYHYATGQPNKTYEEVFPEVKAYHDRIGIPFGHWQFDSWFYPKDPGHIAPGGGGGGVTNWTALPSVFPSGMAAIQKVIGLPTIMHNRQWSMHSDYIHNWTDLTWQTGPKWAMADDPEAFFRRFFTQQDGWGLSMYEQDWMCEEYDNTAALRTNLTLADLWLRGMAVGAQSSGRTIQYCMPYAHDILATPSLPAVTNARATDDYFHGRYPQWSIGGTAILYWALGLLPFKDGFYSSTHPQIGGQTVGPETHPEREALIATLSTAMVGPMDGLGLLNKTRLMQTCRADGVLLKPDAPITTSDECFRAAPWAGAARAAGGTAELREDPSTCYLYHTSSAVAGYGTVHYVFANDARPLTPAMAYIPAADANKYAVYNWHARTVQPLLASGTAVAPSFEGFAYAVVAPKLSGWVLFGEVGKYVTLSTRRFVKVAAQELSLFVTVAGVAGETVRVCALLEGQAEQTCRQAKFDPAAPKESEQTIEFKPGLWGDHMAVKN